MNNTFKKKIGILGGGPSGMFVLKRLLEQNDTNIEVHIYEKSPYMGCGMPYSTEGAGPEHVTNVSGNEIPVIVTPVKEWVKTLPENTLKKYNIKRDNFNDYKVLPRLFFGEYLCGQFKLLLEQAEQKNIKVCLHKQTTVLDVEDVPEKDTVCVVADNSTNLCFDSVVICTGHNWPKKYEGSVSGYYDSPYPPDKLAVECNHTIALKGASLTAIDAMRTLSRKHGTYTKSAEGLTYTLDPKYPNFNFVMHTRSGLLPAVRFHLEDTLLQDDSLLTDDEIAKHIAENNGFLSLDYVFEKDFVNTFIHKDPDFYKQIKDLSLEQFVDMMMDYRNSTDPFVLLQREYDEAAVSIKLHESVYWKEKLAVLSFAMNYPAKHFSAEDMLRLQKTLQPLIAIVIAFIPQSSAEEMMALHKAGLLRVVEVGHNSHVEPHDESGVWYYFTDAQGKEQKIHYQTFVDCTGQPHLMFEDVPFKSLITKGTISPAYLKFRSGRNAHKAEDSHLPVKQMGDEYYLKVPGISINDSFEVTDKSGKGNNRVFIMAVPYISGYNPDYSGIDFCEEASLRIVNALFQYFNEQEQVQVN